MKRKTTIPDKYSGFLQYQKSLPSKYLDSKNIKDKKLDSKKFRVSQLQIKTVSQIQEYNHIPKKQFQLTQSTMRVQTQSEKYNLMKQMLKNFNSEIILEQNSIRQKFYQQLRECLNQIEQLDENYDQNAMTEKIFNWMSIFKKNNNKYFQNETQNQEKYSEECSQSTARTSVQHCFFPKQIKKVQKNYEKEEKFKRILKDDLFSKSEKVLTEEEILKEMDQLWFNNQMKYAQELKQDKQMKINMSIWSSQNSQYKTNKQRQRDQNQIQQVFQRENKQKIDPQLSEILETFLLKKTLNKNSKSQKQNSEIIKQKRNQDSKQIFNNDKSQKPQIFRNNIQSASMSSKLNGQNINMQKKENLQQIRENYKNIIPNKYQDNQRPQNSGYQCNFSSINSQQFKKSRPFSQTTTFDNQKFELKSLKRSLQLSNVLLTNKTLEKAICKPKELSPEKIKSIQLTGNNLLCNPFAVQKQKKRKKRALTSKK